MPQSKPDPVHKRRHPEWIAQEIRWRWLLDSWEGGEAYRGAVYGTDRHHQYVRNLIRHKREYPDPRADNVASGIYANNPLSTDQLFEATDDDYTLRLARTPVPPVVSTRLGAHVSGVYSHEVERDTADADLEAWWADVDGLGTTVDEWMCETVAPLLLALGCLDVVVDHPFVPPDVPVDTRADEMALGLDRAVAGIILPQNMVWWVLGPKGEYLEALVCECRDDGTEWFRHWTPGGWALYDADGKPADARPHPFGRVPIVRLFDGKRPRYRHVGRPRYEGIAEIQREIYNRSSELILSDTTQAHPLLQGPEDYVQSDGTIPIGPSWLLPKKKNSNGTTTTYENFEVVDFPKGGAESIRQNIADLYDQADRIAFLTKPAGAAGTTGSTVAQTGVAKRLDSVDGNNLLAKIAAVLQKAETLIVGLVLTVQSDGTADPGADTFAVVYPRSFDLVTADEMAASVTEFQAVLAASGALPGTEELMLCRLVRLTLPGLDDGVYDESDKEIKTFLTTQAADREKAKAAALTAMTQEPTPDGSQRTGTGTGDRPHGPGPAAPGHTDAGPGPAAGPPP